MVYIFNQQNILAPTGPSSVAKGAKQIMFQECFLSIIIASVTVCDFLYVLICSFDFDPLLQLLPNYYSNIILYTQAHTSAETTTCGMSLNALGHVHYVNNVGHAHRFFVFAISSLSSTDINGSKRTKHEDVASPLYFDLVYDSC